jgi:flagellar hook-length control protein FliK
LPFQNSVDTVKAALLKEAAQQQTQAQRNTQSQGNNMMSQTSDTVTETKTSEIELISADNEVDTAETDTQQLPLMAKSETLDLSKVNIKVADAPVDTSKSNAAEQMADKIIYKMSEGKQEFDLQLNPKELGKLNIKLTFENGNAQVLITCSNSKAQNMMASLTDNIRSILESNTGVTSTVHLQQEDMLEGQYNQDDFNGQSEARNRSQQQKEEAQTSDDFSFIDKLRLGLIDGLDVAV